MQPTQPVQPLPLSVQQPPLTPYPTPVYNPGTLNVPILTPTLPSPPSGYESVTATTPGAIVTTTTTVDCKKESGDWWDCFDPVFMEGKGKSCRNQCMNECAMWFSHSNGLLTDLTDIIRGDPIDIIPADVPVILSKGGGTTPEVMEGELGTTFTVPTPYLYSTANLPSGKKAASLEIRFPLITLAIKEPGHYLFPDGQHTQRAFLSHFVIPVRVGDDIKWLIRANLDDQGRPLVGTSSGLVGDSKLALLDVKAAGEQLCSLMGTSNSKALVMNIEVPKTVIRTTFGTSPDAINRWWNLFRRVRITKSGLPWFPPQSQNGGYGDLADEHLYFVGQPNRPFEWSLEVSLRHLLLFYMIKTHPDGTPLTRLDKRSLSYTVLPNQVTNFFQNWYNSLEQ